MDITFVQKFATKNSNVDVNVNHNVIVEAVGDVQMSLLMNLDVIVVLQWYILPYIVEQRLPNAPNRVHECTLVAMMSFITAIQMLSVRRVLF
jgi:hypothetical protein